MNRALLDLLGRETLVRLTRERGLAPTRENDERRKALAHSYHGDVETLIHDLTRQELVDLFRSCTFDVRGVECFVSNPGKYRQDELHAFAIRAFAGRRVRIPADFVAVQSEQDEDSVDGESGEDERDDGDDGQTSDDDDASVTDALGIETGTWSRPRQIARILDALGYPSVQRLRTARFQELIAELASGGVEACLADDPVERTCTTDDESPGIDTKLRLRLVKGERREKNTRARRPRPSVDDVEAIAGALRDADTPMRARDIARVLGLSRARINAALHENLGTRFGKNDEDFTWSLQGRGGRNASSSDGGPPIVVQAGEKPIPVQAPRPSAYNLAVLRLQFLTAVPSVERRTLAVWPNGYLTAATRGLALQPQELALLRAYAAGLCIGNHSPYDAIPRLTQVLSPTEWETLLSDFQALNPFQPELVQAIVQQVEPITAPRSSARVWQGAAVPVPDADAEASPSDERSVEPKAAASTQPSPPVDPEPGPANRRDLGALAGMFDEE